MVDLYRRSCCHVQHNCFRDSPQSLFRWLVGDHIFFCQNVACCFGTCPKPLVFLQHTNVTPTAKARMDYVFTVPVVLVYTRTYTDHPDHRSIHTSGLDSDNGGTVQLAQLAATAGGRGASSASCSSTMVTPVNTFASGVTLAPGDIDINKQGDTILPALNHDVSSRSHEEEESGRTQASTAGCF